MAVKHWVGGAVAVYDVWDLTLAGTWAATETATITVNGKNFVVTSGGSDKAALATEIIAAFNASRFDDPAPPSGYSRNVGGQQILEMAELQAGIHPTDVNKVRLTARNPGNPIAVTASDTAAAGTCTVAHTTTATGPEFVSNAANYSGGTLPANGDTLRCDQGNVSMKYDLDYFRTNTIGLDWIITEDYGGQIGLPIFNTTTGYREYRNRYMQHFGSSKLFQVLPGINPAGSQGSIWFDFQDQASVAITILAGRSSTVGGPSIFLSGADAATFLGICTITAGNVAIEPDDAPAAAAKAFMCEELHIGTAGNAADEPVITVGRNARLTACGLIKEESGVVVSDAGTSDGVSELCPTIVAGGSLEFRGVSAGDLQVYTVEIQRGATLFLSGGTLTTDQLNNAGTIDISRHPTIVSPTAIKMYKGSSLFARQGLDVTTLIDLVKCSLADVTIELPPDRQFDISAAATP